MITNPNTLGLFDDRICEITEMVHDAGGLVYLDGANMNAILGITRPGDLGVDMMHYNVHKTFTGPHGGGGPGAGPDRRARRRWRPFLPAPVVAQRRRTLLSRLRPAQVHRPGAGFFGNVGILVRGYCLHPHARARRVAQVSENAVLNANYLLRRMQGRLSMCRTATAACTSSSPAPRAQRSTGSAPWTSPSGCSISAFIAPTVYFPLVVPEALMIEPTETESKETLDAFADAHEANSPGKRKSILNGCMTLPITRRSGGWKNEVRPPAIRCCGMNRDVGFHGIIAILFPGPSTGVSCDGFG